LERSVNPDPSGINQEFIQIAIFSQNAGKQDFFVISGRNSGEIESEFYYRLCKTNPISKKSNERKYIYKNGL